MRAEFPDPEAGRSGWPAGEQETIVGRDRELELMEQLRTRASAGSGRLVLISGEAGIGKSMLARDLIHRARQDGALVLSGACYDLSATPPYGPWFDLLLRYPSTEGLPPLPQFITDANKIHALSGPEILHDQIAEFILAIAAVQPLVLVLEDLHWSDQPSMDLLRFLARFISDSAILIVGTYRNEEITRGHPLARMIPTMVRESNVQRLDLRRLDPADVRELVSRAYSLSDDQHQALSNHLIQWSDGNPLFVQETLRTLELDGILKESSDGWVVGDLRQTAIPNLIQQLIEGRLESLTPRSAAAIRVAAVIGQQIPLTIWESLIDSGDLGEAIDEAASHGLIQEHRDTPEIVFRHALVREAVHATIPLHERRTLHRQLAESLIAHSRPDPDNVAYHLRQAGDPRSGEWLIRAGEQAERRFAWQDAFSRYRDAIETFQRIPGSDPSIAGLHLKSARLLRFFDPRKANESLEMASRIALDCGDFVLAAAARFNIGNNLCNLGEVTRGLSEMTGAVETLVRSPEEAERISRWTQTALPVEADPIQSWLGTTTLVLSTFGRFNDATAMGERSLRITCQEAEKTGFDRIAADGTHSSLDAWEGIGIAMAALGRPDEAHQAFSVSHEIHRKLNYGPSRVLVASIDLVMSHFPFRTTDLRERQYLTEIIEQHVQTSSDMVGDQNAFWGYEHYLLHSGDWQQLRELIDAGTAPTSYDYWFVSLAARARLAWYEGNVERAWTLIRTMLSNDIDSTPEENVHILPAEPHRIAAGLALDAGETATASDWLNAHDQWLEWSGSVIGQAEGLLLRARTLSQEGHADRAIETALEALERSNSPDQPLVRIAVLRALGELESALGRGDEAAHRLQASIELAELCDLPFERAMSQHSLAEVEIHRGEIATARELSASAQGTFQSLGSPLHQDRAGRLFQSMGSRAGESAYQLTLREVEVLGLLLEGLTDREIADRLFISHRTVMRHVSHILQKLNVESRTAAAAKALREDLT